MADELPSFGASPPPQSRPGFLDGSSHPTAAMFHLGFKTAAILAYLFCTLFTSNFVIVFVICVLLLAFDFWTVKNVSGRLLVGLRWWNEVKEDGTNEWIFESRQDGGQVNATDSRIFWYSLYIVPAIWVLFAIVSIIKLEFSWLMVVAVALVLNTANLIGYRKCQQDATKKAKGNASFNPLSDSVSNILKNTLVQNAKSFF